MTAPENQQSIEPAGRKKGFLSSFSLQWKKGLLWALISPIFLGTIPILAKLAYAAGVDVFTVVALRTTFAALFMWLAAVTVGRQYIRSSTPAIIGSMLAGGINGLGSIFYYTSLTLISASLGQLINITYLVFVTILLRLAGHAISYLTLFRTLLAIAAIYLLTLGGLGDPNWLGVGLMLVGALSYAIQLVIGQRIMYEIPAPTMAIYAITSMAMVVDIAWLIVRPDVSNIPTAGWRAVLFMGLMTTLSRLTLFLGVKHLGSIQTALLGMLEVLVTIGIAFVLLEEHLTPTQWLGALVLVISVILVRYERGVPRFVDIWPFIFKIWLRFSRPK